MAVEFSSLNITNFSLSEPRIWKDTRRIFESRAPCGPWIGTARWFTNYVSHYHRIHCLSVCEAYERQPFISYPRSQWLTFELTNAPAGVSESDVGTQPWRKLFANLINELNSSRGKKTLKTLLWSPIICSFVDAINFKQPSLIYRFKLITFILCFCWWYLKGRSQMGNLAFCRVVWEHEKWWCVAMFSSALGM